MFNGVSEKQRKETFVFPGVWEEFVWRSEGHSIDSITCVCSRSQAQEVIQEVRIESPHRPFFSCFILLPVYQPGFQLQPLTSKVSHMFTIAVAEPPDGPKPFHLIPAKVERREGKMEKYKWKNPSFVELRAVMSGLIPR